MCPDEAALLASILAQPDEDTPRLVYADWLRECGQEARAEFIRVQVELAQFQIREPCFDETDIGANAQECYRCHRRRLGRPEPLEWCTCSPLVRGLRRRQFQLLGPGLLDHLPGPFSRRGTALGWDYSDVPRRSLRAFSRAQRPHVLPVQTHRGFVEQVWCTAIDWLTHGDAIRARHPITRVQLTTMFDFEFVTGGIVFINDPRAALISWPAIAAEIPLKEMVTGQVVPYEIPAMRLRWPGITFEAPA